jgi:dUTP pyrophosphatase
MNSSLKLKLGIRVLENGQGIELPRYHSDGAAGMDLRAACEVPVVILPGERHGVPTGFALEIPPGYEGQIRPRSGLALRHGVTCLNTPGTIDSDYRGEITVLLINLGSREFRVERGMRIAQLVIAPVSRLELELRDNLVQTERGAGGFGSTGAK